MLKPTPGPKRAAKRNSTAPRPYQRRAMGAYPYYRLAVWCPLSFTFKDNPKVYETLPQAMGAATAHGKGRYRITEISETDVKMLEPFDI